MKTAIETIEELEASISSLEVKMQEANKRTDRLREERDDARLKLRELGSGGPALDVEAAAKKFAEENIELEAGDSRERGLVTVHVFGFPVATTNGDTANEIKWRVRDYGAEILRRHLSGGSTGPLPDSERATPQKEQK